MNSPPVNLDADAYVIVAALASGSTQEEAAAAVGCSARTVRRRLTEPAVRAALDAERSRLAAETADVLTGRSRAAVDRLHRVVTEGTDRDAVAACRVLLDQMIRHRDHVWIADRLADAEARLSARVSA